MPNCCEVRATNMEMTGMSAVHTLFLGHESCKSSTGAGVVFFPEPEFLCAWPEPEGNTQKTTTSNFD